jgi:cytochrome P450
VRQSVENVIVSIKNAFDDPTRAVEAEHQTIFRGVLESKLPPQEKTLSRMTAGAGNVLVAGTLTTAWNLSLAIYYLLSYPKILLKLKEELAFAMPGGVMR